MVFALQLRDVIRFIACLELRIWNQFGAMKKVLQVQVGKR